jgi:pyruvate-formate lyase-activating enzyme
MTLIKGKEITSVIFMGAEPTLDPELASLAKELHDEINCYNIMLTNGLKLIDLEHIDEVIFSIKAYSDRIHRDYTGKSNERILNNFIAIYNSGKKLQVEAVLIPDYIDAGEIERIARFVAAVDKNIPLRIDAYFPVGDNPWRAATTEEVEEAAMLARKHLNKVNCLTLDMKRIGDKPVRIF